MPSTVTDRLAGLTTSVAVKAPCRVATTGAITLSGEQTIDGVAVVDGDRVLVKNQVNQVTNGIYVASTTAWSRALDFDGARDAVKGTTVQIIEGTTYTANWFNLSTANDVEIGTDNITWTQTYVALNPVSQATETLAGIAEIATQTETDTGTDDARFVTPLKLKTHMQGIPYNVALISTNAGATEAPVMELQRNSASPAAADLIGVLSWSAKSSTAVLREFGKFVGRIVDATNATEDFAVDLYTRIAGTLASRFSLGAGLYANGLSDMGAGTINATAIYKNGVEVGSKYVERYYTTYASNADLTTAIPLDDSVPLSSEGTQILSQSVTTTTATQRVRVRFSGKVSGSAIGQTASFAIFRGTTCIGASSSTFANASYPVRTGMEVEEVPGAGTYTYSVNIGPDTGTIRLNGSNSARHFGGADKATLIIEIIEP